jgi:exopolyphosphatase/guanosine-5'-triphosphate,3'-diphosphate pyrophosphatase
LAAAKPQRKRTNGPNGSDRRARPVYSALDLGTNNCRLLVAHPSRDGFRVVDAFSRIVRLGEGIGSSGRLSEAAMDRTIAALRVCASKMRRRGVTRARNIATAACRQADNCSDFLARVEAETGLQLDIISSGEEASLAAAGCRPLIEPDTRHALIFDIGGGSTELSWLTLGENGEVEGNAWLSIPLGVVTLSERHAAGDISERAYEDMVETVSAYLRPFDEAHRLSGCIGQCSTQMLGTSGTVTTLAGVHLDLPRYDRNQVDGIWLSFDEALGVARQLRALDCAGRARHPCIGHERADLVVAGCAILEAICRVWPIGRLRVGDRGLREGVLMSLIQSDREGWTYDSAAG